MTTPTDATGQVTPASGANGSDGGSGNGGLAAPAQPAGTAPADAPAAGIPGNDNPGSAPAPQAGSPASEPAATPEGQGDPAGGGHWSSSMPEGWRDALAGFDTADAALDALKRGTGYAPATRPEDIDIRFPEGVQVNPHTLDGFRRFCVENGLTAAQAQGLSDWQLRTAAAERDEVIRHGEADLRTRWGARYDENKAAALRMTTMLDRHMQGRLAPVLASIGGANDPVIIETLHALSALVSEDSLGGAGHPGGSARPMSTEEYLRTEVFGKPPA